MKQEEDKFTGLPENAFRELKPGTYLAGCTRQAGEPAG